MNDGERAGPRADLLAQGGDVREADRMVDRVFRPPAPAAQFDDRDADRAGGDAYNQRLSERRANAVRAYLMQKGIQANQIDLQWFGEARPRVPTPDGVQNDQNRRAEVFLRK